MVGARWPSTARASSTSSSSAPDTTSAVAYSIWRVSTPARWRSSPAAACLPCAARVSPQQTSSVARAASSAVSTPVRRRRCAVSSCQARASATVLGSTESHSSTTSSGAESARDSRTGTRSSRTVQVTQPCASRTSCRSSVPDASRTTRSTRPVLTCRRSWWIATDPGCSASRRSTRAERGSGCSPATMTTGTDMTAPLVVRGSPRGFAVAAPGCGPAFGVVPGRRLSEGGSQGVRRPRR